MNTCLFEFVIRGDFGNDR